MILDDIVRRTGERVMHLPYAVPGGYGGDTRSFKDALTGSGYKRAVIAEMKFSSPKKGCIRKNPDIRELTHLFEDGGASAVSVLTEPYYFGGSTDTIGIVKEEISLPVLRKDFIIDERQLLETRSLGADAVLLIAGVLGDRLPSFVNRCFELGIEPLVEVHSRKEAFCAVLSGAELIGINNRNL
ncbi:MAG: indole-3-glycerol-phosphate synthase, partial [Candidatus Subteraquimicrobiales bacterium]|nr:indole-3-glycerol-phosphate synthase [Candidatus Subteraquimicrobiales bacterium]